MLYRCRIGLVTVTLLHLGAVHCIVYDFGKIFGWLKAPPKANDENLVAAAATDCESIGTHRRCKFNTSGLKMDADSAIDLNVNIGSRKITCTKHKLVSNGTKRWYGRCDGGANNANFITRIDNYGRKSVYGSIHVGREICRIGPNVLGEDEIQCIPITEVYSKDDPLVMPNGKSSVGRHMRASTTGIETPYDFVPTNNQSGTEGSFHSYNQHTYGRDLFDDSGDNIDLLVVWTKAAECGNAGMTSTCSVNTTTESMMRGLIDLAIAETNTAYELSGIFSSLRLVHAYRDPDYVEGSNSTKYVIHLTYQDDGFLDSVHTKRTLYGADIVQMIVGRPGK
jgi:hypothetical protein